MVYIVLNCLGQIASLNQNGILICSYPNGNMKLKFLNYARIVSENRLLAAVVCYNVMCVAYSVLVT